MKHSSRLSVFVCLALLGVFIPIAASAQTAASNSRDSLQQTQTITGRVVDPHDRPVLNARVVIELPGVEPLTQRTDADGVFRFDGLPAAVATLRVVANGFAQVVTSVNLADPHSLQIQLAVASVTTSLTVVADRPQDLAREIDDSYDRNKSVTTVETQAITTISAVANYAALRLLPGVMNAGAGGRDRFSVPTHIRGGHAWGTVETIDSYPSIDITPVSAEDGGYTAGFSSVIPAISVQSLSVATGGLGVSYGQASGGVIRNFLKRGSAANPSSSLRLEALSLGERIVMGDTGGGTGRLDYYIAGQTSLADYGTAYATFPRPIEGLRAASALAKIGVRTSENSRWEAMYIGGGERHDYFQNATRNGQEIRSNYHTDKKNHLLASRYDWRPSPNLAVGGGFTQNWFRENRIEESAGDVTVNLSRRNRPQHATQVFANVNWRKPLGDDVLYTTSGGTELTWDRFEDVTTTPIGFSFEEQALYWRNSLSLGEGVTLNGGFRVANLDNGFTTDTRAMYDAGAAWIVPSSHTRIFGSWSTGYKLNKAFYLWWGNGMFIQREPATGLQPSTTSTVEAGAEQPVSLGPRVSGRVRVAVFASDESDLFNFGNTASGIPFYDDARTRGVELWTEWRLGRLRPFGSFTWLRSHRTASTNPAASNVDLRFAPLPNYAAGFGTHIDLHRRLAVSIAGFYDDGGVSQQIVNDDINITRFGSFTRMNASLMWAASSRWGLFSRMENVLHRRDLGFDRTVIAADGSARRIAGTQRDPGISVSAGINLQF